MKNNQTMIPDISTQAAFEKLPLRITKQGEK